MTEFQVHGLFDPILQKKSLIRRCVKYEILYFILISFLMSVQTRIPAHANSAIIKKHPSPALTNFQFARDYTTKMILSDPDKREEFIERVLRAEAEFHKPGVSYNEASGLTYDGHVIDYDTGELRGMPKNWSASSKESIHITILSLAVSGYERAQLFVSQSDPSRAVDKAVGVLERKITSFEKFSRSYPGFGGFLPWFIVSDQGLDPAADWSDRMPALDNGQFAWSLFLAADILKTQGYHGLAQRYRDYWRMLARNSVPVFYDRKVGKIRGVTRIHDIDSEVDFRNYISGSEGYYLDDPYEGELMAIFMTLFGNWHEISDPAKIWQDKKMSKAIYRTQEGEEIAVRQGYWYSVQEVWNFFVLPYLDDPLIKKVFLNGEKARSWHSAENRIPGLLSSVNEPVPGNTNSKYISDLGIPSLAQTTVGRQDVVTPYAAFPMIIANRKIGLAWYRVMLAGPSMQGPYGSTESSTIDGTKIAPLITWDGKITTVLALIGESANRMRQALKRARKYGSFLKLVSQEYRETFGNEPLEGENLPFRTPTAGIPLNRPDFNVNREATELMKAGNFMGSGPLHEKHIHSNGILHLSEGQGYIWTEVVVTDVRRNHVLNFEARQELGEWKGFFVELKNSGGELITDQKIEVKFPNTGSQYRTFSVDISPMITKNNSKVTVLALSDAKATVDLKSIALATRRPEKTEVLVWNGSAFSQEIKLVMRKAQRFITISLD